jgi:hypothetical protein
MTFDLAQVRKMIEGDDAPNREIMTYKAKLTCDVSIMVMETPEGKSHYSILLYFPPDQNPDGEESDHEACADLKYIADKDDGIISLDEALRLLGIPPDAQVWISEQ